MPFIVRSAWTSTPETAVAYWAGREFAPSATTGTLCASTTRSRFISWFKRKGRNR